MKILIVMLTLVGCSVAQLGGFSTYEMPTVRRVRPNVYVGPVSAVYNGTAKMVKAKTHPTHLEIQTSHCKFEPRGGAIVHLLDDLGTVDVYITFDADDVLFDADSDEVCEVRKIVQR